MMDKPNNRRRNIFIGLIIVVSLAMGLTLYAVYQGDVNRAKLQLIGAQDAQRIVQRTAPSGELIVQANGFTVYESELKQIVERNNAFTGNDDTSEQDALAYLTELKSVYLAAINEGYDITDEDIKKAVEEDKKSIEENGGNSDFAVYVEAMGITQDEYWELMLTDLDYRRELVIDRYLRDLRGIMLGNMGLEEDSKEAQEAWDKEVLRIGRIAVQQTNAYIVSEKEPYRSMSLEVSPETEDTSSPES